MKTPFIAAIAVAAIVVAAPARADQNCKPVVGSFEAQITTDGCTAGPGLLCTSGRVWGGIQGSYFFTMASLVPTGAVAPPTASVPSIFFFTGNSDVALKDGSHALGIDTGTIDLPFIPGGRGGFASLITFSGPVSGQIRLRGELDPVAGTTSGDYLGTICQQ
jgi:hypothetical protein